MFSQRLRIEVSVREHQQNKDRPSLKERSTVEIHILHLRVEEDDTVSKSLQFVWNQ